MNPKVDFYFNKTNKWQKEIALLRTIVLDCGLTEVLKWGCPCYTLQNNNIVLIHVFKEYCALLFFKGVLLKNEHNLLIQQTPQVQSARQIRFTEFQEVEQHEPILKLTIYEAIDVEKSGLKVEFKKSNKLVFPEEFQLVLNEMPDLKYAFELLTPGRQRAYNLHFSAPKQSKTRASRIEKCIEQILVGKGLSD